MKVYRLFLVLLPITGLFAQDCEELFISEYVEGSGWNKAIEVYNPGTVPVSLANYSLRIYFNGANDSIGAVQIVQLQGLLLPGEVFVLADDDIDTTIYPASDIDTFYNGGFLFNGDDAIALFRNGNLLDVIGEIGIDPDHSSPTDTGFIVPGGSTVNHTLIRKASVLGPQKNWSAGATDWNAFPMDSASSLGGHSNCCFTNLLLELTALPASFNKDNGSVNATVSGGEEPYTYLWSNGILTPYIKNLKGGKYHITLTDGLGCSLFDSAFVETLTNLNEPETSWSVGSNTSDRNLLVKLQAAGQLKLSLYDLLGKHYYSASLQGPGSLRLQLGKFAAGVYLLKLKLGERVQVRKLILK